eukprot:Rmarinus@m.27570
MAVGAWGGVGDVCLSLLPIAVIPYCLLKKNPLSSRDSLLAAALVCYVIRLVYLKNDPNITHAAAVTSTLDFATSCALIWGAVLLFQTMEQTGSLLWIRRSIKTISNGHPVAEVMLISWAFGNLIEGTAGAGTPIALSAPILAELGHDPASSIVCGLILNGVQTHFAAVGITIWWGLSYTALSEDDYHTVGFRVACLVQACAVVMVPIAVNNLIPFHVMKKNWLFILLSWLSGALISIATATYNYEFATLWAGMFGLPLVLLLIHYRVGLHFPPAGEPFWEGTRAVSRAHSEENEHWNCMRTARYGESAFLSFSKGFFISLRDILINDDFIVISILF